MTDSKDNARIQAILASGIKIPPIPEVLLKLQALLRDPDVGAAEVARVIARDGALSGAVFRVVGSPVFGLRAKVDTVERAITLLGIAPTLAILRGIALREALGDATQNAALETLWQRSGEIAGYAMLAAKQLRPRGVSPDQAYSLGMFHDCGLALLAKRLPAYGEALRQAPWPDIPALDQAQGMDHSVLGQTVAKNWQLPENIAQAIRHHHAADAAELAEAGIGEDVARLCAVLNFACHVRQLARQEPDPAWEDAWQAACMQRLGLSEADLIDLEAEVRLQAA